MAVILAERPRRRLAQVGCRSDIVAWCVKGSFAAPVWPPRRCSASRGRDPRARPTSRHGGAAATATPPIDPASVIGGPSTCPRPDAVWAELVTLVPRERLEARLRAVAQRQDASGRDRRSRRPATGSSPPGQVREYRDESHDCAYRARIAAVFVALAIDPARAGASRRPRPRHRPHRRRPPRRRSRAAARARGSTSAPRCWSASAPTTASVSSGPSCAGRAAVDALGPEAGVMALLPVDNTVGGVRLRQWRLPIDAGVRARMVGPRVERYGELGLAAALLSERALDLASPAVADGARARLARRRRPSRDPRPLRPLRRARRRAGPCSAGGVRASRRDGRAHASALDRRHGRRLARLPLMRARDAALPTFASPGARRRVRPDRRGLGSALDGAVRDRRLQRVDHRRRRPGRGVPDAAQHDRRVERAGAHGELRRRADHHRRPGQRAGERARWRGPATCRTRPTTAPGTTCRAACRWGRSGCCSSSASGPTPTIRRRPASSTTWTWRRCRAAR